MSHKQSLSDLVAQKLFKLAKQCNLDVEPLANKDEPQSVSYWSVNIIAEIKRWVIANRGISQEYRKLQQHLQKQEHEIRKHVAVTYQISQKINHITSPQSLSQLQQQLKLYSESLQQQVEELRKAVRLSQAVADEQTQELNRLRLHNLGRKQEAVNSNSLSKEARSQQLRIVNSSRQNSKQKPNYTVDLQKSARQQVPKSTKLPLQRHSQLKNNYLQQQVPTDSQEVIKQAGAKQTASRPPYLVARRPHMSSYKARLFNSNSSFQELGGGRSMRTIQHSHAASKDDHTHIRSQEDQY